ncbi:MAG: 16S rRNA (adenine(1518)-N(6)/adenine(1519)-N(6))-dimethyltransferase RsmA, partial [Candidatus Eremiobacteraeota bacterium]|nr:16S rRNA (adenine(1518)-N(6)/adenine(1519)-N(6))-dimethyltransferase RsmA [Candidatus Eremiobacteraeota bacterium]
MLKPDRLLDPRHPKALLQAFGFTPKKRLGQNFLVDSGAAAHIARLALEPIAGSPANTPRGLRVLEIGAGTGQLTHALLEAGAAVTVIDIDPDMIHILRSRPELGAARIEHADALSFQYAEFAGGQPWRVTGNLPYNIATPLILTLIEMRGGPEMLVVMVQKDVAERFIAKPSTPAYGSLSVAVQYAMHVERAFTLGPHVFFPRPKVQSTVVRFTRRERPAADVHDEKWFLQ